MSEARGGASRLSIECIDKQADHAGIPVNSPCTGQCIDEKQLTQSLTLAALFDGQSTQTHARDASG
mgnify:CR=1 FL=1